MVKKPLEEMTEPELRQVMRDLAWALERAAELMGVGKPRFCLLLFNDPEVAQYIGNCERFTMIRAMRECTDRLELRQGEELMGA